MILSVLDIHFPGPTETGAKETIAPLPPPRILVGIEAKISTSKVFVSIIALNFFTFLRPCLQDGQKVCFYKG